MSGRPQGVSLVTVAAGLVAAGLLLAGIVALAEALRHPGAEGATVLAADPRIDVACPDPEPREGEPREGASVETSEPVEITSAELRDCPETYDRARVAYRGEVVGELLRRDDGAWARLNDDAYAGEVGPLPGHRAYRGTNTGIAVLLPHDVADRVSAVGGPGRRGDVVAVSGMFSRVDQRSGEIAVIRALDGEVVRPGGDAAVAPAPGRPTAAALLAALAVGMVAAERLHARRWRRG